MDQRELEYLRSIEDHASRTGWVAPLSHEDKDYLAYLRGVCKRYENGIRLCHTGGRKRVLSPAGKRLNSERHPISGVPLAVYMAIQ